jgi:hypothetical protein
MSSETDIRKLLKIRTDLEERVNQLAVELEDLKAAIAEIDRSIIKQGFKQSAPSPQPLKPLEPKFKEPISVELIASEPTIDGSSLQAKDGTILGRIQVSENSFTFTPREEIILTISTPPFQSFLIDRVLTNMKTTDETRATKGEITPDQILSYKVEVDGEVIKSLIVSNYGGERRLREIQSSLRWSLDKMYDKSR